MRWGVGRWLAVWVPLMAAQVALMVQYGVEAPLPVALGVLVLQAAKYPATRARLLDLGLPPDHALYLLPPLGLVLFFQCLAGAPRDAVREMRMRSWQGRVDAITAWRLGAGRVVGSLPTVGAASLGVMAVAAVTVEAAGVFLSGLVPAAGADGAAVEDGFGIAVGLLGLVTLLQVVKRRTATTVSWWPTLLLLPALMMWAAVSFRGQKGQMGVLLAGLPHDAANLALAPLFAGVLVSLWVGAAAPGRQASSAEAWSVVRERWRDVAVVWGARAQWTWLGMQVLILGIWFAVSYAMADLVAARHPSQPAMSRSTELARGQRSRVFKVLTVWFYLAVVVLRTVVLLPFTTPDVIGNSLLVPSMLGSTEQALVSMVGWVTGWFCAMAMLAVMEDREAVLAARAAAAQESDVGVAG